MDTHIKKILAITLFGLISPSLVMAQTTINDILFAILTIIRGVVPVIFGLAVVFFLWGLAQYVLTVDKPETRTAARSKMFWGIIIIFVMVSLWGLVAILTNAFGVTNVLPPPTPTLPT